MMIYSKRQSKIIFIVFLIFTPIVISIITTRVTKAEVNNTTISWSSAKPITFSSTASPYLSLGACGGFSQLKKLAGESSPINMCITSSDKLTFGIYSPSSSGSYLPAISFFFDNKMHKVNGVCGGYNSCVYLPGSDALATKQYFTSGSEKYLVIYKNLTKRLHKIINPSNLTTEYNLDTSNPDYIFDSSEGQAWAVGGIGTSNNGKWLGVEFKERGIGLLNIDTLQMKRISNYRYYYNSGMDPVSELAVSNDGEHVAIMGANASLNVFDVDQACGDIATDNNMMFVEPIINQCKTSPIDTTDFIDRLFNAFRPYFSDDGGELSFSATSYAWETRQVSLRAAGYVRQMIDYLALGDSFSSGEGESDDKYYLPGTNDEFEKCHVSSRSYPFLVANMLSINPLMIKNVACSGATTEDVVGDDDSYWGQGDRLNKKYLNLIPSDKTLAQKEANIQFIPGRIHQIRFAENYNPKVITIGIGGNDTGLMSKLKTCVGQGTCYYAGTPVGKEQTAIEIKSLYETLVQTYQKIHLASPTSKIYVVGYPKVIDSYNQCDLINGTLLDSTERQFMNEGIAYINQVVKAAAKTVGIGYIETQDSLGGHVLCGSLQPSAMNAIRLGEESAISDSLGFAKIIGSESFHPNAFGHLLLANSIVETVGDIIANDYCAADAVVCPIITPAPDPSDYWISGQYHNYPTQQIANYVYDRSDSYDNRQKSLVVDDASLEPGSTVRIEITSEPRPLGQFQVSANGSLAADIDLPVDLEEGYHTMHLYGTSYSGELIELYQIIEYKKPVIVIDEEPTVAVNVDIDPKIEEKEPIDNVKPSNEVETLISEDNNPTVNASVDIDSNTKVEASVETSTADKKIETIDTRMSNNEVKTLVAEDSKPAIDINVNENPTINTDTNTSTTDRIDNIKQIDEPTNNISVTSDDEPAVMGASIVAATSQFPVLQTSASDNITKISSPRPIWSDGMILTSAITLIAILVAYVRKFKR